MVDSNWSLFNAFTRRWIDDVDVESFSTITTACDCISIYLPALAVICHVPGYHQRSCMCLCASTSPFHWSILWSCRIVRQLCISFDCHCWKLVHIFLKSSFWYFLNISAAVIIHARVGYCSIPSNPADSRRYSTNLSMLNCTWTVFKKKMNWRPWYLVWWMISNKIQSNDSNYFFLDRLG